jgi:hypothetical protein
VKLEWGLGSNYLEIVCGEDYAYFEDTQGKQRGWITENPVVAVLEGLARFA